MKNALYLDRRFLSRLTRIFSGLGAVLILVAFCLEMSCFAQPGGQDRSRDDRGRGDRGPSGGFSGGGPTMQGRGGFPGGGFPGGGPGMQSRGGFPGGGFPGGGPGMQSRGGFPGGGFPGGGFPGGGFPGGGPGMQARGGFPGGGFPGGGFPGGGFPGMMGMSRRESSASATTSPLVPEFGEAAAAAPVVLKFGDYEQATAMPTVSSANSQDAMLQQQINEQAQQLLNRYDRDKNGMIEKSADEWRNLQIDTNTVDINRDGRISIDELRVYAGNQLRGGQAGTKIFTTFATTYEHLPEGIPYWFTSRDKDNDGQLTMFEYADGQPITEAMIGEFEWLDLNDDGIATLNECYSAIKTKEELESKRLAEESGDTQSRDSRSRDGRSDDRSRDRRSSEGGSFTPGADQERSDGYSRERGGYEGRGGPMGGRPDSGRGGPPSNRGGSYGGPRGGDSSQWQRPRN